MFDRVLQRMRVNVRNHQYVMTVHAWEEMESDGLSVFDVESAILSGRSPKGSWIDLGAKGSMLFGADRSKATSRSLSWRNWDRLARL